MMRTGLFLLAVLGCAAEEGPAELSTMSKAKRDALKDRMNVADWTHPGRTFKKFFGKKGLEKHSLSVKQMEELAVEVKNKSEWQALSMTTYWDCSSQYCLSFKNGRDSLRNTCKNVNNEIWHKGPRKTDHAAAALGLFKGKDENQLFGTVAASSSLGVDDKESLGCGKCYAVRRGEDANFGGFYKDTKLTVMVSNWCPPSRDAPCPAPGKIGEFGTKFHFDLAVPGGGMGTMPTCAHTYEKEDGRGFARLKQAFNNTLHACSELPRELQSSCYLYHKKIAGSPLTIGLAFAEVDCPSELLDRFECNKPCPTCEEGLSFQQLDKIVKKGGKLTAVEREAWENKQSMDEQKAAKHQGFRQKLANQKK